MILTSRCVEDVLGVVGIVRVDHEVDFAVDMGDYTNGENGGLSAWHMGVS